MSEEQETLQPNLAQKGKAIAHAVDVGAHGVVDELLVDDELDERVGEILNAVSRVNRQIGRDVP